ncbi:hypothetical protein [Dyella sp. AtDHG13]|uniref:hypothetical protein n=1 Tax=Dyella sp. AtDHG13 TaxID=1938897 RepID=UPI0009458E7B|nr:hypothetical protein [Dyella sp. AtDHG13]
MEWKRIRQRSFRIVPVIFPSVSWINGMGLERVTHARPSGITMIKITDHAGRKHFVSVVIISDIREVVDVSGGNGIRAHVRLSDGREIHSRDEAAQLFRAVNARRDRLRPGVPTGPSLAV